MNSEKIIDDLWVEFANESDGWQTTMDYDSFKKAVEKIIAYRNIE